MECARELARAHLRVRLRRRLRLCVRSPLCLRLREEGWGCR